jgi:hypothetical protein
MTEEARPSEALAGRLPCCVCGRLTDDAIDYVVVRLTTDYNDGTQFLGAHAACLNSVFTPGLSVEVHLM